jgi:hypothetical protein
MGGKYEPASGAGVGSADTIEQVASAVGVSRRIVGSKTSGGVDVAAVVG